MATRRPLVVADGVSRQLPDNDSLECESVLLKGALDAFLRSNSGTIEARNAANSAYAPLQCSALVTSGLTINSNGSLQTTGAGVGSVVGNARGSGAMDLQVFRSSATQVASGGLSFCVGSGNTSSGFASFATGLFNVASGTHAFCAGNGNTASGHTSFAAGFSNQAATNYSTCFGDSAKSKRYAEIAQASTRNVAIGDSQSSQVVVAGTTTSGSSVAITSGTFLIPLDNDSTVHFEIKIVARRTNADNESAAFRVEGAIDRNATAASTALVGVVSKTVVARDSIMWDVTVDADTTNGALRITVTGETGKTIRWVAFCRLVEVVG